MPDLISLQPIGIIHSPFKKISGVPIQPLNGEGVQGTIELNSEFLEGLRDLDGFSHITLLYQFHLTKNVSLRVVPFMDTEAHGVFATRAPSRPNAIGLSTVRLLSIEQNTLHVQDMDIIDGTPLIDIKPFYPMFDNRYTDKTGWLTGKKVVVGIKSDDRFR